MFSQNENAGGGRGGEGGGGAAVTPRLPITDHRARIPELIKKAPATQTNTC